MGCCGNHMNNRSSQNMGVEKDCCNDGGAKKESVSFTCPMHPDIKQDHEGKCPECGMDLVQSA